MKDITTYYLIGVMCIFLMMVVGYSTASELSIELVPLRTNAFAPQGFYPLYDKTRGIIEKNLFNIHFLAIITNTSGHHVRIFDEWNAWGYFNLYFTLHSRSGDKIAILSKQSRSWRKNAPTHHMLRSGQSEAWAVCISNRVWEASSPLQEDQIIMVQGHFIQTREGRDNLPAEFQDIFFPISLWEGAIATQFYTLEELGLLYEQKIFSTLDVGTTPIIGNPIQLPSGDKEPASHGIQE